MKRLLALLVLAALLLAGCGSTPEPSPTPELAPTPFVIGIEATVDAIHDMLDNSFGEDNYELDYDDSGITINVWMKGATKAMAAAEAGDQDALNAHQTLIDNAKEYCDSLVDLFGAAGLKSYDVTLNTFEDVNRNRLILSVTNGAVVYEALEMADKTSDTPTMGEKNALAKAKDVLKVVPLSYSGLIEHLEFVGYSTSEATYGADNCGADWNEQAAKKAQDYLDIMSFSRQGLVDQLKYEGFTAEQAEYGATAVGY